ncbi:MAG: FGGY family carbohydrate kinase, partial [Planctomycetia bacterium]
MLFQIRRNLVEYREVFPVVFQTSLVIHHPISLFPNPYFSATKIRWILEKIRSENLANGLNQIHAGTVDTFLVWNLTSGKSFLTDHSNASRTMLMDLETGKWDDGLLDLFGIPREILPDIQPSSSLF